MKTDILTRLSGAILVVVSVLLWGCASAPVNVTEQKQDHVIISADQRSEVLKALRSSRANRDFYIIPNIPEKKLANARQSCGVAREEEVLALVNASSMGSAKSCLLVTTGGIYIRNDWTGESPGRHFLSYAAFLDGALRGGGWMEASISGVSFNMAACAMSKTELIQLLSDIQDGLRASANKPAAK